MTLGKPLNLYTLLIPHVENKDATSFFTCWCLSQIRARHRSSLGITKSYSKKCVDNQMIAGFYIMPNILAVRLVPISPNMTFCLRPALSRHIDLYNIMKNVLRAT